MSAPSCYLGCRVKSGWAAVVLIAGPPGPPGPRNAPRLIDSRIVELSDPGIANSRQPYHAGFGAAQTNAAKVDRLIKGIERFSRGTIARLVAAYRQEHRVRNAAVVVASLTDPASIANQHMRAHASEGRLFREVLIDGLERCDMEVQVVLERDVYASLGKALRCAPSVAKARVAALGATADRWRAEQKVATAGAWLVS
jgi:hypothetical protein